MATNRQAEYAKVLLEQAGYGTFTVGKDHLALGAGRRQLGWTVDSWLVTLTARQCSQLIDDLREQLAARHESMQGECWATARPAR